jgi:protocatechuate 3,4-dioxygenase beta subunit
MSFDTPLRHRLAQLLAVLAALAAVAAPAAAQGRGLVVGGQVTDGDGEPLAGAEVELRPFVSDHQAALAALDGRFQPAPADRAVTDAAGRYRLRAPRAGLWEIAARAPGHLPSHLPPLPLFADDEMEPLPLAAAADLTVRVVDAAGRPVAGAQVSAERSGGPPVRFALSSAAFNQDARHALTGDDGRAVLPLREDETVRVVAAAPGHVPTSVDSDAGEVTVRLAAGRPLPVTVTGPDGKPVAGAAIAVLPGGGRQVTWGVSGDDGRATLCLGSDQELRVTAFDAAGRHASTLVEPDGEDDEEAPEPITLALAEPPTIAGRVVDAAERAPIAGAWVWASSAPHAVFESDDRGGFTLPLHLGRWWSVQATSPHHTIASEQLDRDDPAATPPLTLRLSATTGVAGRVVDGDGEPVPGAMIVARPLDPRSALTRRMRGGFGSIERRGSSAGDGTFRLDGLQPDEGYQLTATAAGFAAATAEVGGLAPGAVREGLEIVLPAGLVAFGRVVDDNERPVAGAAVALTEANADSLRARFRRLGFGTGGGGAETASDGEGRFELRDLAAGRFDLAVTASGFAPLAVPGVELPEGEAEIDLGTVLMAPGVALEGRVTDADRRPIAGATITWHAASRNPVLRALGDSGRAAVTSGDDGRFRVGDLLPGKPINVEVEAKGFAGEQVPGVEPPGDEPLVVVLEPAAQLAGRVVDETGAPIENARVLARGSTGRSAFGGFGSAGTGEDGSFTLEDLEPGKITLMVQASGYQALERDLGEVAAGEERRDLRLQLARGATLTGRVLGTDGLPLSDALVSIQESRSGVLRFSTRSAPTDADGHFTLEGLPPGPASFSADHADHVRSVRDLDVRPGENRLDFRLERGLSVAGRVVDENGSPVLGASVRVGSGMRFTFGGRDGAMSDEDGRFELSGVEPGTHSVSASKEGWATAVEERVEVVAPVDGLLLTLTRGARIVGNVLGVDFADLQTTAVTAGPTSRPALPESGSLDFEGGYVIEGLSPGTWRVRASTTDGRQASEEVTIGDGEREVRVDLDLTAGGYQVSGRVSLAGQPLAGATVGMAGHDNPSSASAGSDQNGRFRLQGLAAGSYTLNVLDRATFTTVYRSEIEVDGDLELAIEIETSAVEGVVVDRITGAPLDDVEVDLHSSAGRQRSFLTPSIRTDASGRFRFDGVAAGDYRLRAEKDGFSAAEAAVAVSGGQPVSGLELPLTPTRGLTLYVRSSLGVLPDRVLVAALPPGPLVPGETPAAVFSDNTPPGEAGRVDLDRLPAGTWRLLVAGGSLAVAEVEVTAPGEAVTVTLPPAGILEVVVPELAATGDYGEVRLLGSDGMPWIGLDWRGQPSGEWNLNAGRTRITRLPPGGWSVEVTTPDGNRRTASAATTPGGVSEVRVE